MGWTYTNDDDNNNKFVSEHLTRCPYCGSDEIEGEGIDYDWSDANPKEMAEPVRCLDCGQTWTDVFIYSYSF